MQLRVSFKDVAFLIFVNLVYTSVGWFTKMAAGVEQFSVQYCSFFAGAVAVMGVYALLWQQVLKRIELSLAYMFKGLTVVFVMLMAFFCFKEPISVQNVIGSAIIIWGITLFAKA